MAEDMKKIECPSPCNFSVRSHDEKEIIEVVIQHAKKSHNMNIRRCGFVMLQPKNPCRMKRLGLHNKSAVLTYLMQCHMNLLWILKVDKESKDE